MQGIFYKATDEYSNKISPIRDYLSQLAFYIQTKHGVTVEKAKEIALQIYKDKFKDRTLKFFQRNDNGDRSVEEGSLIRYITDNVKAGNVIAPTFTTYIPTTVNKSMLSEFIFINVSRRSVAKKMAQKAKAEGNSLVYNSKNNEQSLMKTYNNSMSGAFGQKACILYNPTAHSTLTSITRTMTSLANAANEKLIAGNRYYPRGIDVMNNIVYLASVTNVELLKRVVQNHNLYLPNVNDVVGVLKYSSDLYFRDNHYYQSVIIPYLEKLSPYHLANICYANDMYHVREFNPDFTKQMLDRISTKVTVTTRDPDIVSKLYSLNENILNYAHVIFFEEVKGLGKDYGKMVDCGVADNLYATSVNIMNTFNDYKEFYNCFLMTDTFPSNSFRLKNMRRRTVVLSDTDSTCFTLDNWVSWYEGKYEVTQKNLSAVSAISYIASEMIINLLFVLSSNMNIDRDLLGKLGMKNEYMWRSFFPMDVSKHYFAHTVMQEGSVFKEPELEIKGVHLKNSAVPQEVIKKGVGIINKVFTAIGNNEKVRLRDILREIMDVERSIIESVMKGESTYLKRSKIKSADAYAVEGIKSPYARHLLWMEVFAPKYGDIPPPPYDVLKLPTTVTSRKDLVNWVDNIEDVSLKTRLKNWLETNLKNDLPTIYLSSEYVKGSGIPQEITRVIDVKKIVLDVTIQHRLILTGLGLLLEEDTMIKDQFRDLV